MITAQSRLGEVTAQSRHLQYDHDSVMARSKLNHGPGHGSVTADCDHFGHRELTVSSHSGQFFSHEWWSHLRPWVQSICLLYVSSQSDHFGLRYSIFHVWHWKFKVKVMAMVKPDSHIWGPVFNWYVCFLFRGNRTIFGWDIANSIFDLENSRSRSLRKSTKI